MKFKFHKFFGRLGDEEPYKAKPKLNEVDTIIEAMKLLEPLGFKYRDYGHIFTFKR